MQRSFWRESAALFRYRDELLKIAADAMGLNMPRPFVVVEGADGTGSSIQYLEPLPELPPAIKEALAMNHADIKRLEAQFHELAERERAYERAHD